MAPFLALPNELLITIAEELLQLPTNTSPWSIEDLPPHRASDYTPDHKRWRRIRGPHRLNGLLRTCRRLYGIVGLMMWQDDAIGGGSAGLKWAAHLGDVKLAKFALELHPYVPQISINDTRFVKFPDLNDDGEVDYATTVEGCATPLHWAARRGLDDMVQFLLSAGARIHVGCLGICKCRSVAKLPRNVVNCWTPMHLAVCGGHLSTLKLLMSQRPPEEWPEMVVGPTALYSALHSAAARGDREIVEYLLSKPKPAWYSAYSDCTGSEPLHYVALCKSADRKAVRWVIERLFLERVKHRKFHFDSSVNNDDKTWFMAAIEQKNYFVAEEIFRRSYSEDFLKALGISVECPELNAHQNEPRDQEQTKPALEFSALSRSHFLNIIGGKDEAPMLFLRMFRLANCLYDLESVVAGPEAEFIRLMLELAKLVVATRDWDSNLEDERQQDAVIAPSGS
ncbi:ankyrin repeat-containing domain protein [Cercophora newfieldiana]|uniref:protein S-acyltransferase n=1 Tax=Cercophora newfieldiana TaxID=92897 RepID=A0AA40CJD1_9PEZI|nr:ankyrin repeat-containing domain protein [Cercophora newfieldiana]